MNEAIVIGAVFVLVGLSMLNRKYFMAVMNDFSNSKGLTFVLGLVIFIAGAVTLALYNTWSSSWQVMITIIGWLSLAKGTFITLFPNTSIPLYRKLTTNPMLVGSGIFIIVLGVILFYLGCTA